MNFLEIKSHFEDRIKNEIKFELLELHYTPYSFGYGKTAYRIKGRIFQIVYDARENLIEVNLSLPHEKYPINKWATTLTYSVSDFFDRGISELKEKLDSKK